MAMMKRPAQKKGAVNPKMFTVKGLKSGPTLGGWKPVENDLPEDPIDSDMVKNEPPEEPADSNVPDPID